MEHIFVVVSFHGMRPLNSTPSGSTADILIHQRYFFDRKASYFGGPPYCTEINVTAQTTIPVGGTLDCFSNCTSSNYTSLPIAVKTTDCNTLPLISSWGGERYDLVTLLLTTSISIGFNGSAWLSALYGGGNAWSVVNRLNLGLRPDGFINSSPVTTTLPVVFYPINTRITHIIQMADNDGTDILQCRWSDSNSGSNYNRVDECAGVCSALPSGYVLTGSNCTVSFTLPTANLYYACSIQIEDYYNSAATNPMSSVPIVFLFYGYTPSSTACPQRPQIIGVRPNRACIGVPIGVQLNETIVVQTYCPGQAIVDFVTSSPLGMQHSAIANPSANTWTMVLTWTPQASQAGPQGFCAGAVDNSSLQSDPWCITYLVDYTSPNIIRPTVVQGSASPVGTVFANQSMFSIEATSLVGRPTRNNTNICFHNASSNASVLCYDAGYAPNVIYTGYTIVIVTNFTWTPGAFYYVTMDSGFASGSVFCHAESAPITDPTFWVFNIWNPAVSSTTTTTTTPFTTATVTTKPTSTTSINTLLTTTGIVVTTTTPITTNGTTTTNSPPTTAAPTTVGPTTSGATTESTVAVMYPKDFEDACKQTVATMTAVFLVTLMPVYAVTLYAMFTKIANVLNPVNIQAKDRHKLRMKRILR
ncbi:unnamed protein product [Adineta ricciae]|uniref:Uncharacterized protein n=1 Tax=Adineta ricciae TaxID=249248 RepID=A0A814GRR6_ADIRI|nr:unnamed protein product [Adineta ricciae]CAF1154431.1 unnamed protein product [Adineta ricciae]